MQRTQKKILVIDDERDILEFLQELLEQENYIVVTIDNVEEVDKLHTGDLPDLILLDVLLSGKDGHEIVKHLKSQKDTRHIPVIMFSAHPRAKETTRLAGADDFVAKPFELDELLEKVAYHL